MRKLIRIVAGATVLVSATALAVGPALADPVNGSGSPVKPKETDIVSVGADTSEYLLDQLAFDFNKSHQTGPRLYSWDALNPRTGLTDNISTKSGCAAIPRPNGASAGLTAFYPNAKTADRKDFCIDYVRSARGRSRDQGGHARRVREQLRAAERGNGPAVLYLDKFFASARPNGWLCSARAKADLVNYGFLPTPFCGTGS